MTVEMSKRLTRRQISNLALRGAAAGAGASLLPSGALAESATNPDQGTPTGSGGTLVFGYAQATSFANTCVQKFIAGGTDIYLRRFVAGDLVQSSQNFDEWLPDLAERWEFAGNRATFYLRQGVTWHDGTPFTANDVLFTYRVIGHSNTADLDHYGFSRVAPMIVGMTEFREGTADTISGIQVVDDYTVVFEMPRPYREPFLALMDTIAIIPKHILGAVPEDQWTNDGLCKTDFGLGQAIGTGPFKMTNYVVDQIVEYEPFADYWRGKPLLDKLVYRPFADDQALIAALESGEVHVGNISPGDYERFQEMNHLHLLLQPGLGATALYFNTRQINQHVRQALLLALDRETISQTIYHGTAEPPMAAFVYAKNGVNPDIAEYYTYDPERARQLLARGGWDSNRKIRLLESEIQSSDEPLYALIRSYWEAVGVQSEFQVVGADYVETHSTAPWDFDVTLSGGGWGVTPASVRTYFWNPDGDSGVANAEAIDLLEEIMTLEDQEAIKQGVWRLQAMAAEQANVLPIVRSPGIWAINNKVQGDIRPIYAIFTSNYWGLEKIWVVE